MNFKLKVLIFLFLCLITLGCDQTEITVDNNIGTVTDYEGNSYNTIKIGTQWWMVENLKTKRFNDGTDIPVVTDDTAWGNMSNPCYCWYNNDEVSYMEEYGALYNWYTVNTGKLCPAGWHVPTKAEWKILIDYYGGNEVAGGRLKETGTVHWRDPNTNAYNESGYTALPGGGRTYKGVFDNINSCGFYWSSSESGTGGAWGWILYYNSGIIKEFNFDKRDGFSVRCLRD